MKCNNTQSIGAPIALQIKSHKGHSKNKTQHHKKAAVHHVAKKHIKAHKAQAPKKIKAKPVKKAHTKSKVNHVAKKHIKPHKAKAPKKIKAKPVKKAPAKNKTHHVAKKHIKAHKASHKKGPVHIPIAAQGPAICAGGLLNIGNSCWMNTMIQAIGRCPAYNTIINGPLNPALSAQEITAFTNFRQALLPCIQAVRANAPCPRTNLDACFQTLLEVLRPYEPVDQIRARGFDTQTTLFYLEQYIGPMPAGFLHQTVRPGTGLVSQEYILHAGQNHRLNQVICNTGGHYMLLQREGDTWVQYDDANVTRFTSFNAVKPLIDRTGFKLTYSV